MQDGCERGCRSRGWARVMGLSSGCCLLTAFSRHDAYIHIYIYHYIDVWTYLCMEMKTYVFILEHAHMWNGRRISLDHANFAALWPGGCHVDWSPASGDLLRQQCKVRV